MSVLTGWAALATSCLIAWRIDRAQRRHDRSHPAQMAALRRACTRARSPRLYR